MFLKNTLRRNKDLITFSKNAILNGDILPNTYVLDLDSIVENGKLIKKEADKYNIQLYQMTKQFGRNPLVAKALRDIGIDKVVCVDYDEAITINDYGLKIGNVGHLVQMPDNLISKFLKMKPEVMTIFSINKAKKISNEAVKLGIKQNIILKVYDDDDLIYDGQNGGFKIDELKISIKEIELYENISIIGFTAFPTFLYDGKNVSATNNLKTINNAIKIAKEIGILVTHVNTPSSNSSSIMKDMASMGSTHGEPGHAFTGTMPSNAFMDEPEIPAIVYASEISHLVKDKAYFYGGGFYPRGNFENILVHSKNGDIKFKLNSFPASSIDYYLNFNTDGKSVDVGNPVIGAFRTQIFVTRAKVAIVKGLHTGYPKIMGIFDSSGKKES